MAYTNQKQGIGSLQMDQSEMFASCLDIFKPPEVEYDMLYGKEILIRPINIINNEGPFEVFIYIIL